MRIKSSFADRFLLVLFTLAILPVFNPVDLEARTITDARGRRVEIPEKVERVVCSGSGCPRLLTYLQAQRLLVGVDEGETRKREFDARPYAFANPWLKELPMIGMQGGRDNPEAILMIDPPPQVILRTFPDSGYDPVELQAKTGIPVVTLEYGGLLPELRPNLYRTLRLMGEITGRSRRAEEVIAFFDKHLEELAARMEGIGQEESPSAYVGGIAYSGAHGFQSTEPSYPPFVLLNINNLAGKSKRLLNQRSNAVISKEQILAWDPDYLFLDLSTLRLIGTESGLQELRNDPGYRTLTAVQKGEVYGVLPYTWCTKNYDSILADCYFVGKVLYPERFEDIDPKEKADEIFSFLVGEPVFDTMDRMFKGLAFNKIPME